MMRYGWPGVMGGWGGYSLFSFIPTLIFWTVLIFCVVALFHYLGDSKKENNDNKTPLDYLKERYAKGEITKKEFDEIKKDLS